MGIGERCDCVETALREPFRQARNKSGLPRQFMQFGHDGAILCQAASIKGDLITIHRQHGPIPYRARPN
jgi:hypothetical protein